MLIVGLAAYATIPNIHSTPMTMMQDVGVQKRLAVPGGGSVEQSRNITLFSGMGNELRTNVTVTEPNGGVSSVLFQLLVMNKSHTCSSPLIVSQEVRNQSLIVPLNMTGTYCFVFDNQNSQLSKTVGISATILGTTVQVLVSRDGSANTVGLGLGAIGFVVAVYGYSRKTVIPWE